MSENIRSALEVHLNDMSPALPTAWENFAYTPETGVAYQSARLIWAQPDNTVLGCDYRREQGILQIDLYYPLNTGPAAAHARADAIRDHFKRATDLTFSGVGVRIPRTPSKTTLGAQDDRYRVVVSIPFYAELFN